MKQFATILIAAILALAISPVIAKNKAGNSEYSTQATKVPTFLFVLDAKKGNFAKKDGGKMSLVLKQTDINQVIAFSNRPDRITKYITGKELKNLWSKGVNSFAKDPPNAVLSADGTTSQILVLTGISIDRNTVTLGLQKNNPSDLIKTKNGSLSSVVVVIDGLASANTSDADDKGSCQYCLDTFGVCAPCMNACTTCS